MCTLLTADPPLERTLSVGRQFTIRGPSVYNQQTPNQQQGSTYLSQRPFRPSPTAQHQESSIYGSFSPFQSTATLVNPKTTPSLRSGAEIKRVHDNSKGLIDFGAAYRLIKELTRNVAKALAQENGELLLSIVEGQRVQFDEKAVHLESKQFDGSI